jgi:hypothetical protein
MSYSVCWPARWVARVAGYMILLHAAGWVVTQRHMQHACMMNSGAGHALALGKAAVVGDAAQSG